MAHKVITKCSPGEMPEKERGKSSGRAHGRETPHISNIASFFLFFLPWKIWGGVESSF